MMKLQRNVSFVDCLAHDALMAAMRNGVSIMDGALPLVAANEELPPAQTKEHLATLCNYAS
ncbi:putative protein-synthesizing GTPase [Rosa chinensis]|uniref:Uncharacterized protein n=1 Tax=Rosa chinensis TaxID=74649 RepID=A0A2P6RWR4_ROSCH|nr:putative protein-synthesizing GTPase [Rosa chinensis]